MAGYVRKMRSGKLLRIFDVNVLTTAVFHIII